MLGPLSEDEMYQTAQCVRKKMRGMNICVPGRSPQRRMEDVQKPQSLAEEGKKGQLTGCRAQSVNFGCA